MRVAFLMWLLLLGMFQFAYSGMSYAVAPTVVEKPPVIKQEPLRTQREIINDIILKNAVKYGVSSEILHAVISCESQYNPKAIGDHGNSYGLAQIFLLYHPEVSVSQATDPEFAVRFLAKNIYLGNGNMWTCYRNL